MAADGELQARAAEVDADPLGQLAEAGRALSGWQVSDRSDDGRTVTLSTEFDDAQQFNRLAAELAEALAADEVVLLESLELTVADEAITINGAAGAQPTRMVRDYGLRPRQVVREVTRADALDYRIRVTLPGEVVSASTDQVDGATATWQVAPGDTVTIAALGTRPGPPILQAVLGAVAGGLVAGLVLLAVTRARRRN